MKKIFKI